MRGGIILLRIWEFSFLFIEFGPKDFRIQELGELLILRVATIWVGEISIEFAFKWASFRGSIYAESEEFHLEFEGLEGISTSELKMYSLVASLYQI